MRYMNNISQQTRFVILPYLGHPKLEDLKFITWNCLITRLHMLSHDLRLKQAEMGLDEDELRK